MKRYDNWYGIKEIKFIYYNEWDNPSLEVDGTLINVHDVDDMFWEEYLEDGGKDQDFDAFGEYLRDRADEVLEVARDVAKNKREAKELAMELQF